MPASIFQGPTVKILKDALQFFGGNKITYKGSVDPSVSAVAGDFGDIYVQASSSIVYVKQDSGTSTNWKPVQVDATVTLNTLYVDKSGNDSTGTGSLQKPFLTVAAAMAAVTAPSTSNRYLINVGVGTFNETSLALKPWTWVRGSGGTLQGGSSRITSSTNQITLDASFATGGQRAGFQNVYFTGSTGFNFDRQAISGLGSIVIEIFNVGVNGPINFLASQSTLDFLDARNLRVFGACIFSGGSINIYDSEVQSSLTFNTSGTQDLASSIINTPVAGNVSVTSTLSNTAAVNLFNSRVTGTKTVTGSGSSLASPLSTYIPTTPGDWLTPPQYINTALDELASRAAASGDVTGPASSTDNALPRFDGTTGKLIQDSGVTLDDSNLMQGLDQVQVARDAVASLELVTLQQLQAYAGGIRDILSVRAASTVNLTLSGTQTVDTVALIAGNLVLVKNQTDAKENGVYVVAAGPWTRATRADTGAELEHLLVTVGQGSQQNTGWYQITDPVVIGVDNVVFEQFFGAGTYTADGLGIELTGSTFSLELDGGTLSKSASGLKVASGGISDTEINASAAIDASKIANGSVSNTEFQYLDGVTSAIQTQLNAKQATGNYITDLTGDVAATGPGSVSATIAANAVTNSKLAQMANATIKGNDSGSTANPQDLTGTEVTALLDVFTSTEKGLAPASGGGTTNFLRADGTWTTPAASGDVSGPGSSTDNAIARFDGTTGKVIQNSGASIDDSGNITATNLSGTNTGNVTVTDTNSVDLTITGQALTADVRRSGTTLAEDASGIKVATGGITDTEISATANIDASKLGTGVVSTTEFNYLDGVTSPIQTQFGTKVTGPASATDNAVTRYDGTTGKLVQDSLVTIDDSGNITATNLSGTNTGNVTVTDTNSVDLTITGQALTADVRRSGTTLAEDASGIKVADQGISDTQISNTAGINATKLGNGDVNNTELSFLDGVTSSIQTQLDGKQPTGNYVTALTGDVTATGPGSVAATIANNVVSNAKLAQMPTLTIKGNHTGSTANASDMTGTQATTILDVFTSALKGLAPASGGGTANYLRADGTWSTPPVGTGDVVGPASSTDNAVARFDGTTGKLIQNSGVTIDDSGNITATNLSGTNTGNVTVSDTNSIDLTITGQALSADVRRSGTTLAEDASGLKVADLGITNTQISATAAIDATKIADGSVSNTEFQYLDGVTSAIQTQLNGKQATGNYITALTGDVAATGPGSASATIQSNTVSNAKLAQMAANTFKANNTGATANATDITGTQATALLDTFTTSLKGLAPASGGGTTNFLRADGSWANPVGAAGDVVGPASATDNAITRFDTTTGKLIQNSTATLSDTGFLSTSAFVSGTYNDSTTGTDVTLATPTGSSVRLTGTSLASVVGIPAGSAGQILVLQNTLDTDVYFFHNSGGTAANRLMFENNADKNLKPNGTIFFIYDATTQRWRGLASSIEPVNSNRAIFAGGSPSNNSINFFNFSTIANGTTFGTLTQARYGAGAGGSSTRGIFASGDSPNNTVIDYITIATQGNAISFGTYFAVRYYIATSATDQKVVFWGGLNSGGSQTSDIQYVVPSTLSNSITWGSMGANSTGGGGAFGNTVRGVMGGGFGTSGSIFYITYSILATVTSFGTLIGTHTRAAGASNSVRGLVLSGNGSNTTEYVTIATTGNAISFGTMTTTDGNAACASKTRLLTQNGTSSNNIGYVEIATTGNVTAFGTLTYSPNSPFACSDCHGGV